MREEAGGLQKGMPSSGQSAGRNSKSVGSSLLLGIRDTEAGATRQLAGGREAAGGVPSGDTTLQGGTQPRKTAAARTPGPWGSRRCCPESEGGALKPVWGEVRRGVQVASRVATGKSGLHGRGKRERVIALKSG